MAWKWAHMLGAPRESLCNVLKSMKAAWSSVQYSSFLLKFSQSYFDLWSLTRWSENEHTCWVSLGESVCNVWLKLMHTVERYGCENLTDRGRRADEAHNIIQCTSRIIWAYKDTKTNRWSVKVLQCSFYVNKVYSKKGYCILFQIMSHFVLL